MVKSFCPVEIRAAYAINGLMSSCFVATRSSQMNRKAPNTSKLCSRFIYWPSSNHLPVFTRWNFLCWSWRRLQVDAAVRSARKLYISHELQTKMVVAVRRRWKSGIIPHNLHSRKSNDCVIRNEDTQQMTNPKPNSNPILSLILTLPLP